MAIVNFSKKTFEHDIGKFDDKMQNQIAMFGTPIEKIDDDEIQIEVFPNRPDLLSYHGFKRAFLAYLGKKTGLKTYNVHKPEKNYSVKVDSSVKDVRPHTVCAIIRGLKLSDEKIKELIEIQEKMHVTLGRKRKKVAIGIYPLEKIKLPITFKAVEPDKIKFRPLESESVMSGLEILQRHPTGKEYAHLLAGKAKFPIFVDANNEILSMPPIINSHLTGKVTEKTRDVFVECSGSDEETLKFCLNILVTVMAEMGGKIYQMEISYGLRSKQITPDLTPHKMEISLANVNKLLGLELTEKQLRIFLERMGYKYISGKNQEVEIPAWRTDILHPVDLTEDVAIAYGYDNFVPEIPDISTVGEPNEKEIFKKKIAEIFSGIEALEVSNYHLTSKKDQIEKMGLSEKKTEPVEIVESKTDYNTLRENLTHYALKNLSENIDAEYPQKIFETGKVFNQSENGKIEEKEMLCFAFAPGNFTEVKQALEYFFRMVGLSKKLKERETVSEIRPDWFIDGRTEEILWKEKTIGFLGEIHPKILKNWKIKMPVALFEICIDDLFKDLAN